MAFTRIRRGHVLYGPLAGFLLIGTSACADLKDPNAAVDAELDRYGRELTRARFDLASEQWSATCEKGRTKRCGLVWDEVVEPKALEAFIGDVCAEEAAHLGEASGQCRSYFREMVFAKLAERYDRIEPGTLKQHCFAEPTTCRNPRELELWMLAAHNEAADAAYARELASVRDEHHDRVSGAAQEDAARAKEHRRKQERIEDLVLFVAWGSDADWYCTTYDATESRSHTACRVPSDKR